MANLLARFIHSDFLVLVLVSYWISNAAGILLMYFSGRNLFSRKNIAREIIVFLATIIAYTVILLILDKIGILRPI